MFAVAVALALVHALDDAFVHRRPGLGLGPIALGVVATHKWREPVGEPPSAAYVLFDDAATGPVEHWNPPGAAHTHAIRSDREACERRVAAFFNAALL